LLTRDELEDIAVNRFFLAQNRRDLATVYASLAEDCVMRMPSNGFVYDGFAALKIHLEDVHQTFPKVDFSDFVCTIDTDAQRIAAHFRVVLTDTEGVDFVMRNANLFSINSSGLLEEIIIYTSAPVSKGFHVGSG
jgi:hypothetical protein